MALLVRGVEHERKRHFENVGDFDRVGHESERRLDPADNGRDAIAGDRFVVGQAAEDSDPIGGNPISSVASRSAAASVEMSAGSTRPPGKLIWPG